MVDVELTVDALKSVHGMACIPAVVRLLVFDPSQPRGTNDAGRLRYRAGLVAIDSDQEALPGIAVLCK